MSKYYFTKDELYHHGIKGQKWGIRRFQNPDGSYTAEGLKRYGGGAKAQYKNRVGMAKANYKNALERSIKSNSDSKGNMTKAQINKFNEESKKLGRQLRDEKKAAKEEYKQSDEYKARQDKLKKAAIIGAAAVATGLAAYGAYKYVQATKNKAYKLSKEKGENAIRDIVDVTHTRLMYEDHTDTRVRNTLLKELKNDLSSENEHNAKYNSRSFKAARKTLKGNRRISNAELERSGLRTMNPYRSLAAEDALQSYRTARALNNYETAKLNTRKKQLQNSLNKYGMTSYAPSVSSKKRKK